MQNNVQMSENQPSLYMSRIWPARGQRWWIVLLFIKKKKNAPFQCWLEFTWAIGPFKVLLCLFVFRILYSYAFLFTFVICAVLIYFMHEYILEKFIMCIYIWNQMHSIIFQLWNYIWEFYSSLYYILILKYIIWFILIWLSLCLSGFL